MTVQVPDAQFTAEHQGTRYVFCGPGCRDQFTSDTAEFAGQRTQH